VLALEKTPFGLGCGMEGRAKCGETLAHQTLKAQEMVKEKTSRFFSRSCKISFKINLNKMLVR